MLAEPLISHLSETEFLGIVQFLPYRDILRLLSTCKSFQHYRNSEELSHFLLHQHLHIDHRNTPLTGEQASRRVIEYLAALEYKYSLTNIATKGKLELRNEIFSHIKQVKLRYKDVCLDDDLQFLVVKTVAQKISKLLVLGGAIFYNTTSLFHVAKFEQLSVDINGLELYPFVKLAGHVIYADLKNRLGLGAKQRYFLFGEDEGTLKLVNVREEFVLKKGEPYKCDQIQLQYSDFYGTAAATLESDCTTRGIRVRAVARPAYDDPRCSWERIVCTYQIRMSDAGCSVKGAKLVEREWLIEEFDEHENRTVEEVKGEGVIGKYPVIKQGCADFKYESCSMVQKKRGRMSGAFIFKDLSTGERFRVEVKPFTLGMCADRRVEYNCETKTARVIE